jgi:hypothetical protein
LKAQFVPPSILEADTMAERKGPSKERRFWNTQPVPQSGSCHALHKNRRKTFSVLTSNLSPTALETIVQEISIAESGPIDGVKDPQKDIPADPLPLPAGFEWSTCDVSDAATVC